MGENFKENQLNQNFKGADFGASDKSMSKVFICYVSCCSDPYLCVAVVRVPAGSKALLPSDIPNQEVCLAYSDLLNVAADGGRSVDGLLRQTVHVEKKRSI